MLGRLGIFFITLAGVKLLVVAVLQRKRTKGK
jgi:hypothetical protein